MKCSPQKSHPCSPRHHLSFLLYSPRFSEVFPSEKGFDRYGGYLAYEGKATGRFHLETIDGRHFLITPDGHGFISIGVTPTVGLENAKDSRVDFLKDELEGDWDKANQHLLSNFCKWGYSSLGYGSHESTQKLLPYFASCDPTETSIWRWKQVEFPDVFGDAWKQEARKTIETMVETFDDNPNLIGIYWTDIPYWDFEYTRHAIGRTWVDAIRELPENAPGKIRYERFLHENGADASDEDFQVLIAREVYSTIGPITRELAPDTLIFGDRYASWAMPWRVIQEALPWIDVVSVQPIVSEFPAETFERLYRETGKPVMICDHQSSFTTPEHSNIIWNTLPDVASVDRVIATYMDEGFSTSFLIGYNRCQYIDRYMARRDKLKQGLLQVDGTPYEELVDSVQNHNWRIHEQFINQTGSPGNQSDSAEIIEWGIDSNSSCLDGE